MPRVGFEPTISAGERPKTYALDRAATGTGKNVHIKTLKNAPTCFDLIQIILREPVYSLLKSLILKFVKM